MRSIEKIEAVWQKIENNGFLDDYTQGVNEALSNVINLPLNEKEIKKEIENLEYIDTKKSTELFISGYIYILKWIIEKPSTFIFR
jgi:hypothetical protein